MTVAVVVGVALFLSSSLRVVPLILRAVSVSLFLFLSPSPSLNERRSHPPDGGGFFRPRRSLVSVRCSQFPTAPPYTALRSRIYRSNAPSSLLSTSIAGETVCLARATKLGFPFGLISTGESGQLLAYSRT